MDETSQWNACTGYVTRDIVFDQPTDNTMNFFYTQHDFPSLE